MTSSTNLHSGLNDIEGSVSEHTGSTSNSSKQTSYQRVNGFVGVITLVIEKKEKDKKLIFGLQVWPECGNYFDYLFTDKPLYQFLSDVIT